MRDSRAKRIFFIALAVCFALITFLFARRSVDAQMAIEREYPRVNRSLSLDDGAGGVIRVEGEGKLYADDLKAMLKTAGISSKSVKHVIVGDEITEIGYMAFYHLKTLKTLKLGAGVVRVTPGALKSCASLEWLYFPAGLKDIGQDFLYGCDDCRVVSDAPAEALPPMENVGDSARVFAGVDSYEALRKRVGKEISLPKALARWW